MTLKDSEKIDFEPEARPAGHGTWRASFSLYTYQQSTVPAIEMCKTIIKNVMTSFQVTQQLQTVAMVTSIVVLFYIVVSQYKNKTMNYRYSITSIIYNLNFPMILKSSQI